MCIHSRPDTSQSSRYVLAKLEARVIATQIRKYLSQYPRGVIDTIDSIPQLLRHIHIGIQSVIPRWTGCLTRGIDRIYTDAEILQTRISEKESESTRVISNIANSQQTMFSP